MTNINTFAIIDLETNNLPDHNFNKANITELCINAFATDDLLNNSKNDRTPRIVNKLSMIFNPQMMITPEATKKTDLDNFILENEKCFDKNAASTIIGFINHLRQPVCLVAHNGDKFDFPILKRSFDKLQMSLPENLLCMDSYIAIEKIDKNNSQFEKKIELPENDVDKDEEFQNFLNNEFAKISENNEDNKIKLRQLINETTPKRPKNDQNEVVMKRNRDDIFGNDKSPYIPERSTMKSRRVLFSSSTPSDKQNVTTINCIKQSKTGFYVLENIYKRLFNCPPLLTHQAEADVVILQKILMHYGEDIKEYSKYNSILFSSVKPIGTPQAKKKF